MMMLIEIKEVLRNNLEKNLRINKMKPIKLQEKNVPNKENTSKMKSKQEEFVLKRLTTLLMFSREIVKEVSLT